MKSVILFIVLFCATLSARAETRYTGRELDAAKNVISEAISKATFDCHNQLPSKKSMDQDVLSADQGVMTENGPESVIQFIVPYPSTFQRGVYTVSRDENGTVTSMQIDIQRLASVASDDAPTGYIHDKWALDQIITCENTSY